MTFRRALRRLRLKDGDVLLAHRSMGNLLSSRPLITPGPRSVPIIFIENKNDVRRLPFEELERIYVEAKKVKNG